MSKPTIPTAEVPACKPWCGLAAVNGKVRPCEGSGGPCYRLGPGDSCWCSPECRSAGRPMNPRPRPVERCSCDEAARYRAALIAIARNDEDFDRDCRHLVIARRALALEPTESREPSSSLLEAWQRKMGEDKSLDELMPSVPKVTP